MTVTGIYLKSSPGERRQAHFWAWVYGGSFVQCRLFDISWRKNDNVSLFDEK